MIRTILVPLEISKSDKTVIKYAIETAKKFNSKPVFFKTYLVSEYSYPASGMASIYPAEHYLSDEEEDIRKEKENYLQNTFPELKELNYELYVKSGSVSDIITHAVEDKNADLIIIGTTGAKGIEELFGTVSEKLTREVNCPVMVIPDDFSFKPFKKISLALDAENADGDLNLELLFSFSREFNTTLDVVNVSENIDEADLNHNLIYRRINKEIREGLNYFTTKILLQHDEEQAISDYIKRNNIDLLTIVYREHGFFKRLFNPGLRKKLVFHADIPLLVLK